MSATELNERLNELNMEIEQINQETQTLTQRRIDLLENDDQESAQPIKHQLDELNQRLEDRIVTKKAVEVKVRLFKSHAQEAAAIKKQIIGELWPKATKCLSKAQQSLNDLSASVKEIDQLAGTIHGLASQYQSLIGEEVTVPSISLSIPENLREAAGYRLPELLEAPDMKLRSEEIKEAKLKQQKEREDLLLRQHKILDQYFEKAGMPWPKCNQCGEMRCLGPVHVNDETGAFIMNFSRCQHTRTAQGFNVIQRGSRDGLIRLDIPTY
jgi:predicted metal-dependent hydrolase